MPLSGRGTLDHILWKCHLQEGRDDFLSKLETEKPFNLIHLLKTGKRKTYLEVSNYINKNKVDIKYLVAICIIFCTVHYG